MIKAILVFNNHGKPRLSKFYQYFVSIRAVEIYHHNSMWNSIGRIHLFSERGHATTDYKRNISTGF